VIPGKNDHTKGAEHAMEAQKHSKAAGAASDEVTQKFFQEVALREWLSGSPRP
jgi:hypothetical protein